MSATSFHTAGSASGLAAPYWPTSKPRTCRRSTGASGPSLRSGHSLPCCLQADPGGGRTRSTTVKRKARVGHHTQARALWLREKAKTGLWGASNLVEKRVESPRPVKTQNSLRPQNVALEPKLEPTKGIFSPCGQLMPRPLAASR